MRKTTKKTGAQLAESMGYPKAPKDYNWANYDGVPVLRRNPGKGPSAGSDALPKLKYDADTGNFVDVKTGQNFRSPEMVDAHNGNGNAQISNGMKDDPAEHVFNGKTGDVSAKQQDLMDRLAQSDDMGPGMTKIGSREVTPSDLAALTRQTGREHAIIMTKDGQRILMDMGSYKGGGLPSVTHRLLMHSHPDDFGSGAAKMDQP